jgi:hypothetical protein
MVLQLKTIVEQPYPMFSCSSTNHFEGGRKSTKRFIYDNRPVDRISNDLLGEKKKYH